MEQPFYIAEHEANAGTFILPHFNYADIIDHAARARYPPRVAGFCVDSVVFIAKKSTQQAVRLSAW
jgi:hypothetical protein